MKRTISPGLISLTVWVLALVVIAAAWWLRHR
jgi:hypothetical protein